MSLELIIETLISLFSIIYRMAENVKANQERCRDIAHRVRSLERLVLKIQQRGPGQVSVCVTDALTDLCRTLESTKEWMMKFTKTKGFKNFMKSSSRQDKFNKLDKKLTENFDLLLGTLLVEQGDKIDWVCDTMTQRGAPQRRHRAPIPDFNPLDPTPNPSVSMPPSFPATPMPQPGPSSYPFHLSPAPISQSPASLLFNNGFSNNLLYSPPLVSSTVSVPNMSLGAIAQLAQLTIPRNAKVTYEINRSTYFYR